MTLSVLERTAPMSVLKSRDPWMKLVGIYAIAVPSAALITWAGVFLGLLTAAVLLIRLRS